MNRGLAHPCAFLSGSQNGGGARRVAGRAGELSSNSPARLFPPNVRKASAAVTVIARLTRSL